MIIGIGIDIIEVERIKKALQRQGFVERVFTIEERTYCQSKGVQAVASFAARFAAKEALMKAIGTGLREGTWQDIIVSNDSLGKPNITLKDYFNQVAQQLKVSNIYLSMSHTKDYAVAQVILWGEDDNENCNC